MRDWFWLAAVIGLSIGWTIDHFTRDDLARRIRQVEAEVREALIRKGGGLSPKSSEDASDFFVPLDEQSEDKLPEE